MDATLRSAGEWSVQLIFGATQGFPTLDIVTSDPTRPGSSLSHAPAHTYQIRAAHRLVLMPETSDGPRLLFTYQLTGDRLTWHFVGAVGGRIDQRTAAWAVSLTTAPLRLVAGAAPSH